MSNSERVLMRPTNGMLQETGRMLERLAIYDELYTQNPEEAVRYWEFVYAGYRERMSEGELVVVSRRAFNHRDAIRKDLEAV